MDKQERRPLDLFSTAVDGAIYQVAEEDRFKEPLACAVCGVETIFYHLWPGVGGGRPVCWEGGCESDGPNSKLLAALGIVREGGWLTSGPWGLEPPPEGLLAWFKNAPQEFRERVDEEIGKLRSNR